VTAVYIIPSECGKYTLSRTSRWFREPIANDVLTKSPKPSIAQHAADSNGRDEERAREVGRVVLDVVDRRQVFARNA
jgi:hypothetical protein